MLEVWYTAAIMTTQTGTLWTVFRALVPNIYAGRDVRESRVQYEL